jgi:hypothetical protein
MRARAGIPALALTLLSASATAGATAARIAVVSGTPQSAHAWVAPRANRYETKFDAALVVSVSPPETKVRFRCVTRGCEFPASEQPETVTRVDASTYDVAAAKGQAAIKLTVWTVAPETVTVVARPAEEDGPQVRFILNAQ